MNKTGIVKLTVTFDASWVLTKRYDDVLPSDYISSVIAEKYKVESLECSPMSVNCVIEAGSSETESIRNEIQKSFLEKYSDENDTDVLYIDVQEAEKPEEIPVSPEKQDTGADVRSGASAGQGAKAGVQSAGEAALTRIRNLIGAPEFKQLAEECVKVAGGLKARHIVDSFTRRAYIVSINDGYGLTTYLNLFADLAEELGLFSFPSKSRIAEVKIAPAEAGRESPFAPALSYFQGRSGGKIICIDISDWMTKVYDRQFRDFLRTISESQGSNLVFFRVPFVEKNILHDLRVGINDLLFVRAFSIVPFSSGELAECAKKILSEKGFTMDQDAWEIFNARIIAEKNDGRFYGINTIEKVIHEMLYLKQLSDAEKVTGNSEITQSDIAALVSDVSMVTASGEEQLNALIGMDSIRERIREVVAQIQAAASDKTLESPCIHMRFVGSPGTGKTTVARILGKILKEKGVLRSGDFFEYSGRDFCGRYVGETAPKTASMCRDAYGSVLFIDEAYALYRDDGMSKADYGREAIDTLIAEMENHRNDFVVIMAGYSDEMEDLMKSNPGLRSRMPYQIEFPNFSREQLAEMFIAMVRKNFEADEKLEKAVRDYFDALPEEIVEAKDFSNARYVRNLFERTWGKAVLRCQMTNAECRGITLDDFVRASSEKEFKSICTQKSKPIGFI